MGGGWKIEDMKIARNNFLGRLTNNRMSLKSKGKKTFVIL